MKEAGNLFIGYSQEDGDFVTKWNNGFDKQNGGRCKCPSGKEYHVGVD